VGEEARQQRLGEPMRLSSPHPYSIMEAASFIDQGGARVAAHVTGSGDDIRAALAAGVEDARQWLAYAMVPPGPASVRDRWVEHFGELGAHCIWKTPAEMVTHLLS
jgi:hypothetical protein